MKKALRILPLALLAIVAVTIASCDLFLNLLTTPTLTVIDARTGQGIGNVTVTLKPIIVEKASDSKTITGISGSTGSVVFADTVPYGNYEVTATLTDYVFIPFNATIAGWSNSLGKMYGVSSAKGGDPAAVSIFLTWSGTADIDAHFSYLTGLDSTISAKSPWNAYYELETTGRTVVSHGNKQTLDKFASLDVDDKDGEGPETITLLGANTGTATGTAINVDSGTPFIGSILSSGSYYWVGAGEYYLNAYSTGSSLDTQNVKVVITQGNSIKGIFSLPSSMPQKTVSLFRVQVFYQGDSYFLVFMPDNRLVDGVSGIKTIDSMPSDSIFVIEGKK